MGSDKDLKVLFHYRWQFPEVRIPELLAKLVDGVSSSGGSNRNTQTLATAACSSSRPVVASSSVPVIAPVEMGADSLQRGVPNSIDDALPDDDDADDVEPNIIVDDSVDDIAASNPARDSGVSSSGTQQYPLHFSSLDLDTMRQLEIDGKLIGFDTQGTGGLSEFQYKVVESDYRKYLGKCTEFDNRCTWLIRISLRQRRDIWEVKRYNGPHTCLATSISSDHKSLDYHVISTFMLPMVKVDAAVCIKMMISGSVAMLKTSPVRVGRQVDDSQAYFHRLFWKFPLCFEAFRHCKSLVSIDGTHLYGKRGENVKSWSFFLSHRRQHVTPQLSTLVISDRHNGIKAALKAPDGGLLPPVVYRAFCIRHVAVNFALTFKGKDAQRLLVNAAYAKTEVEFDY
ncbi:uncharacterized protein LOC130957604 [Arachis stenosperma]|uniref:uncharacterized protein LOC130957604 n=1 Tax=Arachis stenosperma TaxID=217475 RepID=UPI0025AC791F|nr:uncharacterized protein LOC130957604 [Arachis stenosperma]